jgi:DNA-binding transcriptional ArsR family regulator
MTLHDNKNSHRSDPRIDLLRDLADPVRLRVIDRLGHGGPATVSELAAALRVTMPQLSNHLRRLREAGLVRVERTGRHAIYALADESLHALLPLLDRLTGRVTTLPAEPDPEPGRTCYDHLAGRLGVALYAALRDRGALRDLADGTVEVGSDDATLRALGVDPAAVGGDRRRFAFECFDAQQHAPHLAGAMGDALAEVLTARGWIAHGDGRVVRVTAAGERGLRALGIEW